MPIYEYHCEDCGEDFERLVFSTTVVECPRCGARDPKKRFSVFGMAGLEPKGVGASSTSSCGPCSATSCKTCK